MVRAMLACAQQTPAPRRLVLGATAYTQVRAALQARLAELEGQKDVALSTETDDA
jgi:hypothetical protein